MGKIRDFFYLLVIAVLISLSIIFIGAAFREEYPLWKNQKILEDLRSDVKAEETGDGDPGIDWEKLKEIKPEFFRERDTPEYRRMSEQKASQYPDLPPLEPCLRESVRCVVPIL